MSAQVDVGWPALRLIPQKEIEHNFAVIHAPDRAIGVDLHRQPGWAFQVVGPGGTMRVRGHVCGDPRLPASEGVARCGLSVPSFMPLTPREASGFDGPSDVPRVTSQPSAETPSSTEARAFPGDLKSFCRPVLSGARP